MLARLLREDRGPILLCNRFFLLDRKHALKPESANDLRTYPAGELYRERSFPSRSPAFCNSLPVLVAGFSKLLAVSRSRAGSSIL